MKIRIFLICLIIGVINSTVFADNTKRVKQPPQKKPSLIEKSTTSVSNTSETLDSDELNAIDKKNLEQEKASENPYGISLYEPNYLLPFYYTGSPYYTVYKGQTPDNLVPTRIEFKAQLSFKLPIWNNMFNTPLSLAAAYTQDMFWQLYTKSAYFRETDYQPELFLNYRVNKLINVAAGINHQSNGRGGEIQVQPDGTITNGMERSWNRAYGEINFAGQHWFVDLRAWLQFLKASFSDLHNPDIGDYLGNYQLLLSYKFSDGQVISLMNRDVLHEAFRRPGVELTWSYPVTKRLKLFVDTFSGYGQSLIEYNHYTNSVAVGIALNDWI